MRTKPCRDWRTSLGAYALGHLSGEERTGLEAHLEGCPECRAELTSLKGVTALLPHADPAYFEKAPEPSADLGRRIFAGIEADERRERRRRRRRRLGFGLGGATAAAVAAALLVLVILPGGTSSEKAAPAQHVEFASLPPGVEMGATLEPHAFGTEIHVYVSGVRSGTLCRVFLRSEDGRRYPAGSFRYRWGSDSDAVLSSALDLSRTAAIGIRAGNQTFTAPVGPVAGAFVNPRAKEAT